MIKKRSIFILLLVGLLFSAACALGIAPEVSSSKEVATPVKPMTGEIEEEAWLKEWNKLVQAAQKERKVTVYSGATGEVIRPIAQAFQNNLGIPVDFISMRGAELAVKITSEHKAGLYLADVYIGSGTVALNPLKSSGLLEPLEPALLLPQVKDLKLWWGGELPWVDTARTNLAFTIYAIPTITINNTMVKAEEIKSYRDLLHPRWKGKITLNDPSVPGIGGKWFSIVGGYIMNMDFMRELAKQEPVILRDQRLQVDWLAKGRYPVGIAALTETVTEYLKAGASLSYVEPVEGTWLGNGLGGVSLMVRSPHPNAAKVFINWILTREAQNLFSKAYGAPSGRLDVPTEGIEPITIPKPGVKYVSGFKEEVLIEEAKIRPMAREVFGHLMGR